MGRTQPVAQLYAVSDLHGVVLVARSRNHQHRLPGAGTVHLRDHLQHLAGALVGQHRAERPHHADLGQVETARSRRVDAGHAAAVVLQRVGVPAQVLLVLQIVGLLVFVVAVAGVGGGRQVHAAEAQVAAPLPQVEQAHHDGPHQPDAYEADEGDQVRVVLLLFGDERGFHFHLDDGGQRQEGRLLPGYGLADHADALQDSRLAGLQQFKSNLSQSAELRNLAKKLLVYYRKR